MTTLDPAAICSEPGNLVNDLLAYSRIGTTGGDFDLVDMNNVAGRVMRMLSVSIAESGAEISMAPLPMVWVDMN
jgi:light-regulated signal transduction histidine kinase (bacteriophytochrome)